MGAGELAYALSVTATKPARDFKAAGRISIRQPPGSVSVQLRLGLRPRYARFAPRLPHGAQIFFGQLLVVVGRRVELGGNGVLRTSQQDRRGGQRFFGQGIHKAV